MQINHLRNHYSDYVFSFLKKYSSELNTDMKIIDVGAGHLRNLKLFEKLGFTNLYALDRERTDNPLKLQLKEFKLQDIERGITYEDQFFDIVLCNFVLMFINPKVIDQVVSDLLRITDKFLIIETNPSKDSNTKETYFQNYSFKKISNLIKENEEFEILQERKYYEKLLIRRVK